ncbi:hypothetical protein DDE18_13350 [Nocardioides gansuensis]|uniref:GP-PDE domain-containing protein n=1 Tax=Nocardioides gansuensis TaxID=2138300 RepID=A0A2T8F9N6_9ACTN|nr:glycerophosphodiester phosphodiesterase [Nocardioides gansuensis]PVG82444.1 hypothetical protein DDE18_13350 [Nocardioides gansuensis]
MPHVVRRRRGVGAALTLALATAATALPAHAADAGQQGQRDFSVTAHRGGPTRTLGENTMAAFRHSIEAGATAIETDLRRTRDDELVVLHDSGVGRTTNCTGPIGDWTLAQLDRRCREDTSGKPLPHFDELLAFAQRKQGLSLMVELKGSNWSVVQVRRVVRQIKDARLVDRIALSSLRVTVLERVRQLAPGLGNQLIASGWRKVRETRGKVGGYNVPADALTRTRVKRLRKHGITVVGGLSETPAEWQRLQRLGVDGVVVSKVDAYRSWLG